MAAHSPFLADHIIEPSLSFGGSFPATDPKMGIRLYGPYSGHPGKITLGIIGDGTTVDRVRRLVDICSRPVDGPIDYPLWTQDFPGMNASSPFRCELVIKDEWCQTIPLSETDLLEKQLSYKERIGVAADLFAKRIARAREREASPSIFICAPPKRMMDLCLPTEGDSFGRKGKRSRAEKRGAELPKDPHQRSLLDFLPDLHRISEDMREREAGDNFHHMLKAKAMALTVPTQFIRPYTLERLFGNQTGGTQDLATVCWNLAIALFYKAGGRPWRLTKIPSGTCYAGISFYHEKKVFGGHIGTSLAQVFTPERSS